MADPQAIGAVSSVLRQVLTDGLGGIAVGLRPPDKMDTAGGTPAGLNLYLYQVERSGRWHNLPMPNAGRATEGPAPLALVLRYLLTAFGEDDLAVQDALERALGLLTDVALLRRELIRSIVPGSSLARQGEPVRLTLINTESRDLFHLWSTFQAPYRTSVLFEVEVVLVESRTPVAAPPPVLKPPVPKQGRADDHPTAGVGMVPPFPTIESVEPPFPTIESLEPPAGPVLGERVRLRGHDLGGTVTVRFTASPPDPDFPELFIDVAPGDRSDALVTVPIDPAAGSWRAGTYQVVTLTPEASQGTGAPDFERESNVASFELAPRLVSVGVNGAAPVADPGPGTGPVPVPAPVLNAQAQGPDRRLVLDVTANPPVGPGQRVVLLLNGRPVLPDAPPAGAPAAGLTFTATGVDPGPYWLRLRVDGVDSRLIDRSQSPPTYRAFRVEVT